MTEDEVRQRAAAICRSLVAGDVGQVVAALSDELQRNPGEVVAMLPQPAVAAEVARLEGTGGGAAFVAILDVTSETEHLELQTRWKERNGEPRIVEVSHLSRIERPVEAVPGEDGEETGEPAG
jgi:hypothetical protein